MDSTDCIISIPPTYTISRNRNRKHKTNRRKANLMQVTEQGPLFSVGPFRYSCNLYHLKLLVRKQMKNLKFRCFAYLTLYKS